jgi:hypothetical protein
MKYLQSYVASIALIMATPILFGMNANKAVSDVNTFASFVASYNHITFTDQQKTLIATLYMNCANNTVSGINKVITYLNHCDHDQAEEIVAATLYCAGYQAEDTTGVNLLAKKHLRKFIFNAFLHNNTTAIRFFQDSIDCGIKIGNFKTLFSFFNKILLKNSTNDTISELPQNGLTKQFTDFVNDCEKHLQKLFKHATKIEHKDTIAILKKLQSSFPQLSLNADDSSEEENASDSDDDDGSHDSSEDSDGISNRRKDLNDYADYLYEHKND